MVSFANTYMLDDAPAITAPALKSAFGASAAQTYQSINDENQNVNKEIITDTDINGIIENNDLKAGYTALTDRVINLLGQGETTKAARILGESLDNATTPEQKQLIETIGEYAKDFVTRNNPADLDVFLQNTADFNLNLKSSSPNLGPSSDFKSNPSAPTYAALNTYAPSFMS